MNDGIESSKFRNWVLGLFGVFVIWCMSITHNQVSIWQNSKTLWSSVINQYPLETSGDGVKTAYKNMGDYYASRQMFDSAFLYYNVLASVDIRDAEVYSNLGNIYAIRQDLPNAIAAFTKAVQLDSSHADAYIKRGIAYSEINQHDKAIDDFGKAILTASGNEEAYILRAKSMLNASRFKENLIQCSEALQRFPDNAELWFFKAISSISLADYQSGIEDLNRAIALNPTPLYYYNLASAYHKLGNKEKALTFALKAKSGGFPVSDEFIEELSNRNSDHF